MLFTHVSGQRPAGLTRHQVDSVLDEAGIPAELKPTYDVFLDSTQETDTLPYTYRYTPYERGYYVPPSQEKIKFEKEQQRYRSWRKPAGWMLVIVMIVFARWAYKEIRRYNRGRLVIQDDPVILHDMPDGELPLK
jgi:hypothetical protein